MGNSSTRCCKSNDVVDATLDLSATPREALATWLRQNVPVTDVYEIMDTLGEGHMGVVYKIRRKVESDGLHNELTRLKVHKGEGSEEDAEMGNGSTGREGSVSPRYIKKEFTPSDHSDDLHLPTISPKPVMRKISSLQYSDDASAKQEPSVTESHGRPKGILKNASHISLESKKIVHDNVSSDDDDDEEDADNGDQEMNDSDVKPKTARLEHRDSIRVDKERKKKPHFDTVLNAFGVGCGTIDGLTSILAVNGTDADEEHSKKDSKWVPKRTIRFQRLYACKTIATDHIQSAQMKELMNEIYMMRKMDHPYIIRLYEVYQEHNNLWLVMDLCTGGNLTTRKLKELDVVVVAEQILRAISYMHVRGICHRDLKMENILYENSSKQSTIRLIDFGISQTYEKKEGERKPYGGAAYTLSPEVASGGEYTSKSDVWSIGVIVWILLAGDYPFLKTEEDLKNDEKMQRLKAGNYSFGITWKGRGISDNAKLFVQGCLKKDPEKRWSAVEALEFLQDQWIATLEEKGEKELLQMEKDFAENPPRVDPRSPVRKYSETKVKDPSAVLKQTYALKVKKKHEIFDHDIIADIRRFIDYGLLKKTVLLTMANMLDRQDVGRLQETFLMADTTHSGTITMPELKNAFKTLNIPDLDDDEMEKIFKGMDHDHSGQIHYAEFLAALAEGAGLVTQDSLSDAFDRIDIEGKGYITHDDLKAILGHSYNKGIVDKMIEEGDFKKNNRIEFDELLQLMILPDEEVNLAT